MPDRFWISDELRSALGDAVPSTLEDAWQLWHGERVDENRLRHVERVELGGETCYAKRFVRAQGKDLAKLRLQTPRCASQAEREQLVIERLGELGIGAARVLARGETLRLGLERRSLLVVAEIEGQAMHTLAINQELLDLAAKTFGRCVRGGVFAPDLGLDHAFVTPDGSLALIDFHRARFGPRPSARELGRAVVRFFKSPGAERVRSPERIERFAALYLESAGRQDALERCRELCAERLEAAS